MSELSPYSKKMRMLQQRLHREELKLARLKTKANVARQSEARVKVRLGNLIYLMNWQELNEFDLEKCVVQVKETINDVDRFESHRISGEKFLRLIENGKSNNQLGKTLVDTQRTEAYHQLITIGDMFVKHGLDNVPKSVLLGALLDLGEPSFY